MDTEDDSTTYLKFLNDGAHNYLLHGSEVALNDTVPVEPIFTEIEASDWPTEGFPILLNSSLISEDCNNETSTVDSNVKLFNETAISKKDLIHNGKENSTFTAATEIHSKTNSLFLTGDVLLQFHPQITEQVEVNNQNEFNVISDSLLQQNENNYSIALTDVNSEDIIAKTISVSEKDDDVGPEVIQLLNIDGTVTTINKSVLTSVENANEHNKESVDLNFFIATVTAHKCKVCSFLAEETESINSHLKTVHSDIFAEIPAINQIGLLSSTKMTSILNNNPQKQYTVFLCSECNNGFSDKEELKNHMITLHSLSLKEQDDRTVSTTEQANLEKKTDNNNSQSASVNSNKDKLRNISSQLIKTQQKALKKIKCSITGCGLRFAREELRLRHEECHVDQEKKQFRCPECKEKFSIWRVCSMHLWKCHKIDLGLLTCPMCNLFKSNSPVRVLNHMLIHNEERPFLCQVCGKGFKQHSQLRNHQVCHMPAGESPNWSNSQKCTICDRFFSDSKSLKKHIRIVHDKYKPFICNICGHKTARKSMLELHLRQHTGDKPHHCQYCEYKTSDLSCLRKHVMRHVGDMKYRCPYCNYQTIQSSPYKKHLVKKHPDNPGSVFTCTYCSYCTINEHCYRTHIKLHESEAGNNTKNNNTLSNGGQNESASLRTGSNSTVVQDEDDETQNCFLSTDHLEEPIDTGGITIPAGFEMQLVT